MADRVPVRVGEITFLVEVSSGGGPTNVGMDEVLSFDGVRATVEALASEFAQVWAKVAPHEATVEFGLNIEVKSGKLTGLLVEGKGSGSVKVALKWLKPS